MNTFSNVNKKEYSVQIIDRKESWPQENIGVSLYRPMLAQVWDDFVRRSKNATFLHLRNYMDYHRDRFVDHSLLFYQNGQA